MLHITSDGTPKGTFIRCGKDGPLVDGVMAFDIHGEAGEVITATIKTKVTIDMTCFHDESRKYKVIRAIDIEGGR